MLKKLKFIAFIFIGLNSWSQKPMVQLIVEPKTAQVGEEITITVKTNIGNNIDIDLPASYLDGNTVMRGSNIEMDYNTGKLISFFYLSQTGTMTKEGSFVLGPAYVKKGSKVFKSNTLNIKIEKDKPAHFGNDISSRQMRQPAFGIIEKSKNKIYEGEPLVLSAKIYARFSPNYLDGYQPFKIEGVIDEHNLGNNQNISVGETSVKGVQMYSFEYDKKLLFLNQIGKQVVSPFKLNLKTDFDGYSFTSNSTTVEVLALPKGAPKDFTGGVGDFKFARTVKGKDYKQGDVFELIITISGTGNIHNIDKPKLNLPQSMSEYGDPIIEDDYTYSYKGSEGGVKYIYHIQLNKSGSLILPEQTFSYFDPNREEYVTLKEPKLEFNVVVNPSFVDNSKSITNQNNENEQIVSENKELGAKGETDKFLTTEFLVGAIGVPLVIALIFLLIRVGKKKDTSINEKVIPVKTNRTEFRSTIHEQLEKLTIYKDENELYSLIPKIFQKIIAYNKYNDLDLVIGNSELLDELSNLNLQEDVISEVKSILLYCDQARFGMVNNEVSRDEIIINTKTTVVKILAVFD